MGMVHADRDDMGPPVPDPALRAAAPGVEEGFVTCHQHNGLVDDRWDKTFEWSHDMQHVLEANFGTKTFRANQRQAINASIDGKDVFVLMPTGGGGHLLHHDQLPLIEKACLMLHMLSGTYNCKRLPCQTLPSRKCSLQCQPSTTRSRGILGAARHSKKNQVGLASQSQRFRAFCCMLMQGCLAVTQYQI